jgi:transposase
LIPVLRRVWALRGQRPVALGRRRYEWLYVFGFVRPSTGEVFWLFLPRVNTAVFQVTLELFAKSLGVGPHKRVLLVVDGAGWHVAGDLQIPQGLRLVFLPAYSPELQPAERLWPLLRESIANRPVETLTELEEILRARCMWLSDDVHQISGRVRYHWWPVDSVASR